MNHAGLFAFGLTTCVLVPTALHVLAAGPAQVAKLVAPPTTEIVLNDATVAITADRAILGIGDKLHVTVTARAAKRTKVRVALLAYESTGTSGGRVETPPNRIGRGEVTLDVKGGEATQTFAFTLPGDRARDMEGTLGFTHYRVLAMSPEEADDFDRARRRAERVENPMEGGDAARPLFSFNSMYEAGGSYDDSEGGNVPHTVGRLDVVSPARGGAIALAMPDHAKVGDDIEVTVTLHNRGKLDATGLTLALGADKHGAIDGAWLGMAPDGVAIIDPERTVDVPRGKTVTATFHVTATEPGTLALFATTRCGSGDCYQAMDLLDDVAMDAIDVAPADHPPQVVDL